MCSTQNILTQELPPEDEKWWVVLGDLGLSRQSEDATGKTTAHGSSHYMAPEVMGKPFSGDPKSDIWCFRETILYVLTACHTFPNADKIFQYQQLEAEFPDDGLMER
jgi:serine/threonine protein kinase